MPNYEDMEERERPTGRSDIPTPSELSEFLHLVRFFVLLLIALILLAACALLPIVVAEKASPWLGLVMAAGGFWVWSRFGPRPGPGLVPGALCVSGFAAIVVSFVTCAVLAVRG
ncbi:MAG: hypothetical protein WD847_18690 [Pirellulales bacterium]